MIKLNKPKFWDMKKISFFSIILFPLSLITLLIISLKKIFIKVKTFNIPIICIGNIYIGGTGKTPTAIFIAEELTNNGRKPAILRKFYNDHTDEYDQIRSSFKSLILNKYREEGIKEAKEKGYDTVILDDGLQDYRIKKNLNIVCFNKNQLDGNGLILPSGPLREKLNAIKNVHIVLINGNKDNDFEKKLLKINKDLEIYYSFYNPVNINEFKNKKLLALAGIANPENFFMLLQKNGLTVSERLIFPDHYKFTKKEFSNIMDIAERKKLKIIMTEKDFFKIKDFGLENLSYLKVSLEINNKEKLINRIKKIYD